MRGQSDPSLWGENGVRPAAAQQGRLADCWFLAAVSAMAEHPDRIKKIFRNTVYSKVGVFEVKFWNNMSLYPVTIDDRLPLSK